MQQVRGGVVTTRGVANGGRHLGGHEVARAEHAADAICTACSRGQCADANDIRHAGLAVRRPDRADVGHLTAGLEVERRLRERHEAVFPCRQPVNRTTPIVEHRQHLRVEPVCS